jgi:hypothetical protein
MAAHAEAFKAIAAKPRALDALAAHSKALEALSGRPRALEAAAAASLDAKKK